MSDCVIDGSRCVGIACGMDMSGGAPVPKSGRPNGALDAGILRSIWVTTCAMASA